MVVWIFSSMQIRVASVCLRESSRAFSNCENKSSTRAWSALNTAIASCGRRATLALEDAFLADFLLDFRLLAGIDAGSVCWPMANEDGSATCQGPAAFHDA